MKITLLILALAIAIAIGTVDSLSNFALWNKLNNAEKGAIIGSGAGAAVGTGVGGGTGLLYHHRHLL